MTTYILRRTLILIPTLFAITIIVFTLMQMAPGDAADMYVSPEIDPAQLAELRARLGLDQPLHIQYYKWVTAFFTGHMGYSFSSGLPVWYHVKTRVGPTLLLMGTSLFAAYLFAIPIGILSAIKQYSLADHAATTFAFIGVSMPNFWLGLLLIYLFAVTLHWLPSFGMRTIGVSGSIDLIRHLILPVIVLGTAFMASATRFMRAQVLEVKNEEYVKTARSKGIAERWVIGKHILKNSLIPIVTLLGLQLPVLLGGSIITESVFAWPGLGFFYIQSVGARDYPAIMALLTIGAIMTLMGNFLADLSYGFLDPRIRYD